MKLVTGLLLAAVFVTGCAAPRLEVTGTPMAAPYSRHECGEADWFNVGVADGASGADKAARYSELDIACSAHGYRINREKYETGYAQGSRSSSS